MIRNLCAIWYHDTRIKKAKQNTVHRMSHFAGVSLVILDNAN
ncbi:hypothetical protein CLV25_1167 [Acetobacteroides hydrogenigenes]|uniref:Uncharacterized protein n=1 Tax=Acetobacteroides hydrogenigenes TaxID=979970 RepID=A0A4R2EG19_9BACT|nr:hypothetical protein CLV25_1167 [Acetobacteroides hydrogenigenes]